MKFKRAKLFLLCILALGFLFFSSDFGLIDIEKTAIITAIAVDIKDDEYEVSMEIAVPEATDANTENQKALLSTTGKTIGSAIKNAGNQTGWFPKLAFCNLIILGEQLANTNVIKVLDYFAKTLRIQDSATLILANGTAKDLLKTASPLDNIASFALQKVILKNPGFDNDVANVDIRTFCSGYYSYSNSAYMPLVKKIEQDGEKSQSGSIGTGDDGSSQSGSNGSTPKKGKTVFDATTTALFKDGIKVGELNDSLTLAFNLLTKNGNETLLEVNQVDGVDYLLTILSNKHKTKLVADNDGVNLSITLDLYCKISDRNATSNNTDGQNEQLSEKLIQKAKAELETQLKELVMTEIQTECDFLGLKEKLYRFNHPYYARYKDNLFSVIKTDISVSVSGQK